MKPSFGRRLASYIIDIMIVTIIVSLICYAIPTKDAKYEEKLDEVSEKFIAGDIAAEEYIAEYKDILYTKQKNDLIPNTINIVLTIAYFVVFQYMNKGQTLGKKLLHIKVVNEDNDDPPTMIRGLLRSFFIFDIISTVFTISLISVINKDTYMNTYAIISFIESVAIFVTAIMILYRKDGRGLHDIVAHTRVVEEKR